MAMLRAYLVDATYEWLNDHGFTPYALIDTQYDNVEVPWRYVESDSKIVLNMGPGAIDEYECTDEFVSFKASFDGEVMAIFLPIEAIMGIYAKETGHGLYARENGYGLMINEGETSEQIDPNPLTDSNNNTNKKGKGNLRLV